jgi:glycosyltransferase involved in cell wall biosynthesis
MQNRIPRVSIGLPVYNGEKYLPPALDSLLAQTFTDFEIIISDNASTDSTPDICKAYAARDARIRYERRPENIGVWRNFNHVFKQASGEYYRWHAADDVCAPEYLERCVAVLDANPDVVLCFPQTSIIDGDGNLVFRPAPQAFGMDPDGLTEAAELKRRELLESNSTHARFLGVTLYAHRMTECFGLTRTELLRQTQLHRNYVGSEKVLLAEQCFQGRFHEVVESLFFNRRHRENASKLSVSDKKRSLWGTSLRRWFCIPPAIKCAAAHFMLPWQYPLSFKERLMCLGPWLRYVFQIKKWRAIFRDALDAVGLRRSESSKARVTSATPWEANAASHS